MGGTCSGPMAEDRSLQIFGYGFDYRFHFVLFDLGKQPLNAEDP